MPKKPHMTRAERAVLIARERAIKAGVYHYQFVPPPPTAPPPAMPFADREE